MKKLLILLALLVALPLSAGTEISDILLSSSGTLYTVASEVPPADAKSDALMYLVLTERNGDTTKREVVPATNVRGAHLNALLGHDAKSGTLFVFWTLHFGYQYHELLFCTRDRDGNWSAPSTFGSAYNERLNLRIAVTNKVTNPEGGDPVDGLTVHATWWEYDTQGRQAAKYRMLPIENGQVKDASDLNLSEFLAYDTVNNTPNANPALLKQPLLSSSAKQDSVLLVFANTQSGAFSQVRITPTLQVGAEGRIRIPVGKREKGYKAPDLNVEADSRLEGVFDDHGLKAMYAINDSAMHYVTPTVEGWSESRTVALDEQISSNTAVSALRKMVSEQ